MFGSANKTSIFGTQTTNASAFGSPGGFGSVSSTPGTTFGALQPQQQSTSLFGGTPGGFGSTTGTGLFGTQPSLFGSATTPQTTGFGAAAPAAGTIGGTFGSTPGTLFGTPSTSSQPLFGASKFGSSLSSPFGTTTATATPLLPAPVGTTIKFNPLVGSDTMMKNGVNANISTRHQCITCMKEYESKSLEELRLEDYQNNRKGPTGQVGSVGTVFGSTPGTSLFNPNQNTSVSFNAPNTGGLFGGMNKTTFGATPSTTSTSSLFNSSSFNKTPGFTATATSPFGAVQPQQQQPSLFGQTTAPTFSSPNFFSGTPNTSTVKSVFGSTTTTQPSLFSSPATTNTLGGKSLFGNQTTTFGNANTGFAFQPTSTASTGLFSSQPSLFNNTSNANTANKTPMFSFPTQPLGVQQPSTLGTGTGTGTSGSLFNTGSNIFGTGTSMFGATNTGSSLFSNNSLQTAQNQTPIMSLQQLSASTQPSNTDLLLSRLQVLPYGNSPLFQDNAKNTSPPSLKFTTDPKTLYQYKVNFKSSSNQKLPRSPNVVNKNATLLFDGLEEENPEDKKTALDIFVPRRNVKKLILKSKENINNSAAESLESFNLPSPIQFPNRNTSRSSLNETVVKSSSADATIKDLLREDVSNIRGTKPQSPVASALNISCSPTQREESYSGSFLNSFHASKCNVILTRTDYYTIPSLEQLESVYDSSTDTCVVDKFTVGRHGYGSIYWEGPIDVKGLNLDDIVHIRRKEVIVYPDDETKPLEAGKGLNRPAQITLHQVWPVDKTTHEVIKDVDRLRMMKYAEKIENATIKLGAYFKEYRPESGTWVFSVKHFSKYGLLDDEDDSENIESEVKQVDDTSSKASESLYDSLMKREDDKLQVASVSVGSVWSPSFLRQNLLMDVSKSDKVVDVNKEEMNESYDDMLKEEQLDVADKYNSMRAVMFDDDDDFRVADHHFKKSKKFCEYEPLFKDMCSKPFEVEKPLYRTKREVIPRDGMYPLEKEIICDVSCFCAPPVCRVNIFNGTNNFCVVEGNKVFIRPLKLIPEINNSDLRFETQFKEQSLVISSANHVPFIETRKLTSNPYNILRFEKLVKACFAELSPQNDYGKQQERLNYIIDWLCEQNKSFKKPKNLVQCILCYLAANDVKNAVDIALKSRYPKLALLICCGDNIYNKESFILQLDSWKNSKADQFIGRDLMKLYVLLSGGIKWILSNGDEIDVLEDLTWTQQLSLMLLFMTNNGLSDCIANLTVETDDVEYHILAEHPPWNALSSAENIMEAWFLHESLKSYNVISDSVESDVVHGQLASALVSKSVNWSCFVACHIRDDELREYTVSEILSRSSPSLTVAEERWLVNTLLIPKEYVAKAKAVYFESKFNFSKTAINLLDSRNWLAAHQILMEHIFPELVINDHLDVLRELIEVLKPHKDKITDWFTSGAHNYDVYCDFVEKKAMPETETTFNIHMIKCNSKKHVLCQSEMAGKVGLIQTQLTGGQFALNAPIPDDYVLKELKFNCRNLLQELCK